MRRARVTAEPTLLLTGFAPFGGEAVNPSWEAVRRLDSETIAGHRVCADCLPTEFGHALRRLRAAVARIEPALVLCVGQAGGRAALSIERVAINLDDARIPDNAGRQPIDRPVVRGGPAAYFTTLPIKAMRAALCDAGIPAEISHSAGTYVCNHVFYGLMHLLASRPGVRGGFLHIPYAPEQVGLRPATPSMAQGLVIEGLRIALDVALTTHRDRAGSAGTTH